MRRLMLATTMVLAACGEVHPKMDLDASVGSDAAAGSDSGAGSDSSMPLTCATASDCGTGKSCELTTHMCVAEALTVDQTADFVVEGSIWWTSVSDPILTGTWMGPTGSTVQAIVGTNPGTVATLNGNTWTVKLPTGSVTSTDTFVKVLLTDPSNGSIQKIETLKLDTVAPMIAMQTSNVHDERGDTIDFSTGEPVHTHAGANINLASGSCPAVYMYAYLMDGTAPMYGSQAAPNPLMWNFTIMDTKLDPTMLQFRVRTDTNTTLLNWTALPTPDAAGIYHVTLTRAGGTYPVAELGTRTGLLYIDVKAVDWNSQSTVSSFCFDYHPIPAPAEVTTLAGPDVLGFTTAGDSPISKLYSSTADMAYSLATHTVTQYTAEPIAFTWTPSTTDPTYSKTVFADWIPLDVTGTYMCCSGCASGYTPPAYCNASTPAHATNPEITTTGTAMSNWVNFYQVVLRDAGTGAIVAQSTVSSNLAAQSLTGVIPARTMGEAPHVYKLQLLTTGMSDLGPDAFSGEPTAEYAFQGLTYTGRAEFMQSRKCTEKLEVFGTGTGFLCTKMQEYHYFVALDREVVNWNAVTSLLKVGIQNTTPTIVPYHVPMTAFTYAATTWDTGDDDLPGPY